MSKEASAPVAPKFYQRDKRWLVTHDKTERLERGDLVEVPRSNGQVRIVEIQDEVLVGTKGTGKNSFYLMKDVTALYEQGYLHNIARYRGCDGRWWGWGIAMNEETSSQEEGA